MSILKQQVNFSLYFSSFFSVITHNSSVTFYLMHFLLWKKVSHEGTNFDTFKCFDENSQIPHVIFQTTSEFLLKFCMTLQSHAIQLLCTFLGQTLYTLHKRNQSKCKSFRLFGAWIKIHQILIIFETKSWFSFKFCSTIQYHTT